MPDPAHVRSNLNRFEFERVSFQTGFGLLRLFSYLYLSEAAGFLSQADIFDQKVSRRSFRAIPGLSVLIPVFMFVVIYQKVTGNI